jgi:hypothetical protein
MKGFHQIIKLYITNHLACKKLCEGVMPSINIKILLSINAGMIFQIIQKNMGHG